MNKLILLVLLVCLGGAHIYSSSPRITYNYDGYPYYYSLFLSLETGIGATDYLRLIWPEALHVTNKHQVTVNLISFSNSLQVATSTCVDESVVGANTYHVKLGYAMQPKTWYELQVYPSKNPTTRPISELVQLLAVSDYNSGNIIYDSNMAFAYVNIEGALATPNTLAVVCNSSSTQKTVPSAIYSYDIYLTPTVSSSSGGNFTIFIYYDGSVPAMVTGTTIIDFSFMGLCQSAATNLGSAAVLLFCSISSDLSTITFAMSSVTAGTTIRISTSINNPAYYSIRGIKAYWTEFISGRVMENGFQSNALQVNKININTVTPRTLLFWGIETTYSVTNLTTLPLFKATSASPNILPYNSFNIGFSFAQSSPISGNYIVYVTIGATGVAQGTIAHNLPAYSGSTVYCYYDTTNKQIVCKNVGAFINTSFRYFVSGKAYFDFGTSSPINQFGAVAISPIVYSSTGVQITTPVLYTSLAGESIPLQISQEFLDTSGYHNTGTRKIGNAQVVSYYDDLTLSSTANGIQGFLQGSNSSVGVIPDLGTSQQLLFLLNTPTASIYNASNGATDFTIQLLFNSYVIGFESSGDGRGLDFVGYLTSSTAWSISGSPCYYHTVVCEKYNNDTPRYNTKTLVSADSNGVNWYGQYNFKCGTSYIASPSPACTGSCQTECTMFTNYALTDQKSAVMSMRQIVLPTGYHTPLYADKNLLDFLLVFKHGTQIISYCLINAYSMTGAKMQNIKAAYVNYYDYSGGTRYNKGVRVPMMVRIGGGVLPAESNGATAIGIFFDDNVDATTFYTSTGNSWAIGCSTGTCNYYPNQNIRNSRMDNWLLSRQMTVFNLPPIQNQFNILVPVTPDSSYRNPPKYLTIVFFTQNYTVGTTTGLLYPLAVYRLFGPVVTGSVTGALSSINTLSRLGSTPDFELSSSSFVSSGSFGMNLNTSNMYSNPTNNTIIFSNSDGVNTFGTYFGGGYTLTCFYYNIFASATLAWATVPANTATTCTIFGYVYNEIQAPGTNTYKNGQWMYVAFCPIDGTFTSPNIDFLNPQYPLVFTNGYELRGVLTIAYSSQYGFLRAYRHETNAISTLVRTCTTAKLQTYNPTSSGQQRATFTLTVPAITMSATGFQGFQTFRVQIAIPSSTITGSSITMQNYCDTTNTLLSCKVNSTSTSAFLMEFKYQSTGTATITYLEVNVYAKVAATFQSAAAYTVTVYLPQYLSGIYAPFGDTTYTYKSTYCTCQSSFTVGITAYGAVGNLNSLTFASNQLNIRSKISFIFGANSYRDAFFKTSFYQFNFGFLTLPSYNPYYQRGNFRCMIYEGSNSTSMTLSSAWQSLVLSNFAAVTLSPKAEISNPSSIVYKMQCYGGATPTGVNTTSMTSNWKDGSDIVQTAPTIANSSLSLSADPDPTNTATIAINAKRLNTQGMKALYSFQVTSPVALTSAARFYFNFHMNLSPSLDHSGVVECYTRTSSTINDAAAKYTYCAFTSWWELMVWNNQNSIGAGVPFYIDIYNIDQPKQGDVTANTKIMVTIDTDDNYANGVSAHGEVTDTSPSSTVPTNFKILSTQVTSNYILSKQTLTMSLDMLITTVFNTATSLYVLFPSDYAQWIYRSQTIPVAYPADPTTGSYCAFNVSGVSTNLATSCTFISQRILQIALNTATNQYFSLTLMNINTPAAIPSGKFNQYRFKLFLAGAGQTSVSYYSFTDYSQHLTLTTNPALISLSWNYYSLSVTDSLFTLTSLTNQVITVQQGYYSKVVELRQSQYPSNYKATLQLTISNYASKFVSLEPLTVALGKPIAYFRLAAKDSLTLPGLYTLQFSKAGDTGNVYTNIPPLTLVVQNTQCALTVNANTYTLPIGGMTLPILIDAINCIPIDKITFSLTFTGTGNSQFTVNNDLSTLQLQSTSVDGKLYFIVKHTVPASGSLVAGNSVTATINIGGANSAFYLPIPSFTLTLVDATTFQTYPTGTALSAPTLSSNRATFQLQCSQASRIYWGIGVYPSILNNQQVDFEARIISGGNGLLTNFSQTSDYYAKVYGVRQGTTMQVISKTLYNLQSNVNYIFKYFCVNQLGHVSDSQSINFTTLNYGAYLMKVQITFRGSITYQQYNDLSCSLALNFIIPYTRILTETMSYCGNTPFIFYQTSSSTILNEPDSNGWYIYGFYIEPDYTLAADTTNANIRNQLSLSTQATIIITSTANYNTLPALVQMQTTDIQIYTTPIMSVSSPISGLTSVVITASITNMNGFIIIGMMEGAFDAATMTIPSITSIKNGQFSATLNLTAVQMIHTTQNYNTTFQFSGLSADTLYTFFYFCTVEDPSITALSSAVSTVSAQTLQMLVIDINWQPLFNSAWIFSLLFLAMFF